MPLIDSSIPEFKVKAFHEGKFKTVTQADLKGKWVCLLLLSGRFHLRVPDGARGHGRQVRAAQGDGR